MKKEIAVLVTGLLMFCGVAWAGDVVTYDPSTGTIHIPRVAVGSQYYEVDLNLASGQEWTWSLGEIRDVTSSDIVWGNGLTWQQSDDGVYRTFVEAEEYCSNLSLVGYNDWRVPMLSELRQLVYCSADSSVGRTCPSGSYVPTIFADFSAQPHIYWTTDINSTNWNNGISFVSGGVAYLGVRENTTISRAYVRCVR